MSVEKWLSGPVEGVHPLLMPAAHAFLQVREEIATFLESLPAEQIWSAPAGSASIGFHAMHLAGATERLLTYARGESLSESQTVAAKAEKSLTGLTPAEIVETVQTAMDAAVEQLRHTSPEQLTEVREVGRQRLPSTVIGLVFHAAEHATRHAGQIATLRKIVTA